MKSRWTAILVAMVLLAAGCGDDAATTDSGDGGTPSSDGDGSSDGGSGGDSADGTSDGDGDGGIDNNATGDDDDFGDIIGDDDFNADDLDDDTADMIDDIDDIVSVGDCVMETIGIGAVAPEGYFCTVLDAPIPGFDGFTLKSSDSELEVTIGSKSPVGPCDFEGICGDLTPVDISGFSDAMKYDQFGVAGGIVGSHDVFEADLAVTVIGALTDEHIAFVDAYAATLTAL